MTQIQISAFLNGSSSFIPDLMPSDALKMPLTQVMYLLEKKLGGHFYTAFKPENTVESHLKTQNTEGSAWLKKVNMVGVNVRTIGNFWNVVKYVLTLPEAQSSVHFLPIWEPGVVASLYGMSSWCINPEFFSAELFQQMPHLDTVEKQLKVVTNVLHGLGKSVGMDVIPHTDRFSEQVIANPQCFEWLQRIDFQIVKHNNNLHKSVQSLIFNHLKLQNTVGLPPTFEDFFAENFPEKTRLRLLFGEPSDYGGRLKKREIIIQFLYDNHFETVPATMGPPYRGLKVDTEGVAVVDEKGREWRDFVITKPEAFSRVFGPLTRYKLYENKNDNADWAIDFEKPIFANWDYVARHYKEVQAQFNFDFMRGDMAHVQMRAQGVPNQIDTHYDIMQYIKHHVQKQVPYFGSFAETFLAPAGEMAYGDEVDHLEMTDADSTLGDLQSMTVGSERFLSEFKRYLDILYERKIAPNFTIMTGDKDDPRFDEFYLKGNEIRFFIALFLTDMPSYMALGFEQRDPHPKPAPNEYYTKLYVFHLEEGSKSTSGPYVWGHNEELFLLLNQIKKYSNKILKNIQDADCQWIIFPNETKKHKVIAWTQRENPTHLFVANLDIDNDAEDIELKLPPQYLSVLSFDFSTLGDVETEDLTLKNDTYILSQISAGEGQVYLL